MRFPMRGADNEAGVFWARNGYYKGKEVTVTHRCGDQVWLEDYQVGKLPTECGCWVPNSSVNYKDQPLPQKKPSTQKKHWNNNAKKQNNISSEKKSNGKKSWYNKKKPETTVSAQK